MEIIDLRFHQYSTGAVLRPKPTFRPRDGRSGGKPALIDDENELGDKIATFVPLSVFRDGPDLANPTSSWRRMLLTQPPLKYLKFFTPEDRRVPDGDEHKEFSERLVFRVDHAQGITMDILMRKIEDVQLSDLSEHSRFHYHS